MTFALISNTAAGSTGGTTVTTTAIDTSGANLIVIVGVYDDGVTPTLSDSASNTWNALTLTDGTFHIIRIWYAYAPTTSATHTFTLAVAGSFPALGVSAWSGSASSPFDQESGNTSGSTDTISTGTMTPTEDNELIIGGCGIDAVRTITCGGGNTELNEVSFDSGDHYGLVHSYNIQTSLAACSPNFTWTTAASATARGATFKAAAAGLGIPIAAYHYNHHLQSMAA